MKFHLGHLLGFSAIIVAGCAAFFSVYGLSQLFAGAGLAVIIMASSLELSKLVAATFLHRYWSKISKILKIYLTVGVIVLAIITSAGIYGFLSSAYQQTAFSLGIHEGEVGIIDGKINQFTNKMTTNGDIISSKNLRVTQLGELRAKQEVRLDSMINRRYFSNANATRDEITKANDEIKKLTTEIDELAIINNGINDSISKYEIQKLELKSSSEVSAEVGPLKYLSELVDKPMDVVVNYFILLLILVFDPLAISLVIATNWLFENRKKQILQNKYLKHQWTPPLDPQPEDEVKPRGETYPDSDPLEVDNEIKKPIINPETGELDLSYSNMDIEQDVFLWTPSAEDIEEESNSYQHVDAEKVLTDIVVEDNMDDEILDDIKVVEQPLEKSIRKPITIDDINEIKNKKKERGFSVDIVEDKANFPDPVLERPKVKTVPYKHSSNKVERIGSNKFLENDKTMKYKNGKQ